MCAACDFISQAAVACTPSPPLALPSALSQGTRCSHRASGPSSRPGAPRPSGCHPMCSPPGPLFSSPRAEHAGILQLARSSKIEEFLEAARSTVEALVCPGSGHEGEFDSPHPGPRHAHAACFKIDIPRLAGPRRRHISMAWLGQQQRRARGHSACQQQQMSVAERPESLGRSAGGPEPPIGRARGVERAMCSCVARGGSFRARSNRWTCLKWVSGCLQPHMKICVKMRTTRQPM